MQKISDRNYWSANIGMGYQAPYGEEKLQQIADDLVTRARIPKSFVPSGYAVKPGERVLLAVNSFYDAALVNAVVKAIVKAGATVDVLCVDMGLERELEQIDELRGFIYNWKDIQADNDIRNWSGRQSWAEKAAAEQKYDLLIHGVGQPPVETSYRSDTIPWTSAQVFRSAAFPREVWDMVEEKAWDLVWNKGRGGRVRITDPEGTDLSFSLFEEFYDPGRYKDSGFAPFFGEKPFFCHMWACPTPPYKIGRWDAEGVACGTTNHFSCPYPRIKVYVRNGKVTSVDGGGAYGDEWREMLEATKDIQYPGYPDKGMFWFWEAGMGTNPKMLRPSNAFMLSGCGTTFERLRSGVVHLGIGTAPLSAAEAWAKENGKPLGHLHVHLLNCTYTITAKDGTIYTMVKDGHLTSLDDPEVIKCAEKYGDPKEILREDWHAPMPGITVPGDYEKDYAPDPLSWLKAYERKQKQGG
jgi:hypothetical protein